MYKNVSEEWKTRIYKNVQSKVNVYFDDILVNSNYIIDFKIENTLFDDELELGGTPSQYIEIQIHKKANIKVPKQIKVEYGIQTNNELTASIYENNSSFEMIPIGIYNVEDFNDENDNVINIKALDNMIKFEFNYDGSNIINEKGYVTLKEIAEDICEKAGVELRFYFFY